jgi:hypothetical protein
MDGAARIGGLHFGASSRADPSFIAPTRRFYEWGRELQKGTDLLQRIRAVS